MIRRTRCHALLVAALVALHAPSAYAADAPPAGVDPATAAAAAEGAICPAGQISTEEMQVRQQDAVAEIARMLAAQVQADPDIKVLNGTGYNYAPPGRSQLPPGTPHR